MKKILLFAFLLASSNFLIGQSIGIIGSATPGAWDTDTDLTQDPMNPDIWTISMTLFDGAAKFRQDDDWVVNWGSADFPAGIGEQDGADIPVFAGDYLITFNSATGEYNFDVDSDIGIIGDATPGLWDADTDMYKDQTDPNKFFIEMDLVAGNAKFRFADDWATNWGSADFPAGIGEQDGADIPIPVDGTYFITLDSSSGEYLFDQDNTFASIGLIGDATPGGWDVDTNMMLRPGSVEDWRMRIDLVEGACKFRADDDWADNWGDTIWPSGIALPGGGDIPVPAAGDYFVEFNSTTGAYKFTEVQEFTTVGIIGDATPGLWDTDTDMEKDPNNPHLWSIRMDLTDGEAKFRAEDDWPVNWGSGDFPIGTGTIDGANIPVTAGEYIITLNSINGDYTFTEVVEYGTVGLIGLSGPNGDWDVDVDMEKDAGDFNLWTLASATLTDFDPMDSSSGIKFRAEDDWAVNWGAEDFPNGTGTQDGANIQTVAGTYGVTFRSDTGEYVFGDPLSNTQDLIDPASITVYPNPTSDKLLINLDAIELNGKVNMTVIDMSGKSVMNVNLNSSQISSLNVSELPSGNYLLQISNSDYFIGKRFSIAK